MRNHINSFHSIDKSSHHHDTDESDADYDDESDLGPTLDNFGAKLDGSDAGNELPIFLVEPQSAYVVRNRAATLKCKAAHALQVHIIISLINVSFLFFFFLFFIFVRLGKWECMVYKYVHSYVGVNAPLAFVLSLFLFIIDICEMFTECV